MSDRFFGVGCMVPRVEGAEDPRDWAEKVKRAFEAVPSVQKFKAIEINDLDFYWMGNGFTESDDREIYIPESGIITFEVKIPARLQTIPLLGGEGAEVFRVTILFNYVHPVTYIECVDALEEVEYPSMALVTVREFLREELAKRDSPVALLILGPSPFHADFSLRVGSGGQPAGEGFTVDVQKSLAYDRITYYHESTDALWRLYTSLQEQFSYFYQFVTMRNARLAASSQLSKQSKEIADSFKRRGLKAYLSRTMTMRHKLQSAQLDAVSARLTIIRHKRDSADDLEGLYPGEEAAHLRRYLGKVIEEDYLEEIESSEKILEVLDSRHSQELQRFATIAFSLLGVVIGAALTAVFRSWWG